MNRSGLVGVVGAGRGVRYELDVCFLVLFLVVLDTGARILELLWVLQQSTHVGPILTPMLALVRVNSTDTSSVLKTQVMMGSPSSQTLTLKAWTRISSNLGTDAGSSPSSRPACWTTTPSEWKQEGSCAQAWWPVCHLSLSKQRYARPFPSGGGVSTVLGAMRHTYHYQESRT